MVKDNIIQKIQKLLALAGNNPNEHERQRAMERAHEMLAEHQLTMAEVQASGSSEAEKAEGFAFGDSTDMRPWEKVLLSAVARLNYCVVIETTYSNKARSNRYLKRMVCIGTRTAAGATKSIYTWMQNQIAAQANNMFDTLSERISFSMCAASQVSSRIATYLEQERERLMRDTVRNGSSESRANALMCLRKNAEDDNQELLEKLFGDNVKTDKVVVKPKDIYAGRMGYAYGNQIPLERQVEGSKDAHKIGGRQ